MTYSDLNEIGDNLAHLRTHELATTGIHGAVSIATASKILIRDAAGRAQVAAPSAAGDIAIKATVTTEATARAVADGLLADDISDLGDDKVDVAGDMMTGPLVGDFPDTSYTTAMLRNIKLLTSVPGAGDLENGEIAMVYEV